MPRKDGSDTIYSAKERLAALVLVAVCVSVESLLADTLDNTIAGQVLGVLIWIGALWCFSIAVLGRVSNDL